MVKHPLPMLKWNQMSETLRAEYLTSAGLDTALKVKTWEQLSAAEKQDIAGVYYEPGDTQII